MSDILYCPQCRTRLISVKGLPFCEICEREWPVEECLTPLSISEERIYQDVEASYTDTRFSELTESVEDCCFHTERQNDSDVCYIREDLVNKSAWQPMESAPKHKFILIKVACAEVFLDSYIHTGIVQEDVVELYGFDGEFNFSAGECAGWMPRPE